MEDLQDPPRNSTGSLADLVGRHREFLSLEWKERTPAEISEKFKETYGWLPAIRMELSKEQLQCDVLHRARWVDPASEDISDPVTFSYPRTRDRQVMGRANLAGVPVFYACGSANSSFAEARSAQMDDRSKLMRSEWKFADDRKWLVGAMIKHGDLAGNAVLHEAWGSALREYILKCDRIPQEHILLLHDLVAELFLQQNYEVTSWIAHQLMQEIELVQMLMYPSLRTAQQDLCHAFHAAPIDQGRVALSRVEQVEMIGDDHRSIRTGIMCDGRIEWVEGSGTTGGACDRGTASTHCDVISSKSLFLPPTDRGGSQSIRSFP